VGGRHKEVAKRRPWRFQFGLRTLLGAVLLLPPVLAALSMRWRDERLWRAVRDAKQRRDAALVSWRVAYGRFANGTAGASQEEAAAQQRYYAARQETESALKTLYARYGNSEKKLIEAMQARQQK
jgi:hypothetical protein